MADSFENKRDFNFKIEGPFGFKRHFENLIKEKRYKTALDEINMIREKYLDALEFGEISSNTTRFHHFKSYWKEQSEMRSTGKTYPDGSGDKVIFELNQLEQRIKELMSKKIDLKVLALYLWYDRSSVPENQWDIIAKDYGFDNGKKLKQHFNSFTRKSERTADPESKAKLNHKIELFEKVRDMLEDGKRGKIEDEIGILKSFLPRY